MAQTFINRSALAKSLSNIFIGLFGLLNFILYKAIGLHPWQFNYLKLFKWNPPIPFYNYGFRTSLLGTFWNILYGLAIAYVNYAYIIYFPELLPKKIGQMITRELKFIQGASFGLLGIIQMIYGCRQDTIITALNDVQGVDDRLMQITGRKVKNGCTIYCMFVADLVLCAGVLVAKRIELADKPLFQYFMTVYPSVFSNFLVLQYAMVLDIIVRRFIQLYYAIIRIDNEELGHLIWRIERKQTINSASRQRKIEFISNLLEDLDDIRMDVIWFFGPQLGIAFFNMAGIAAFVGYDINLMWKGKTMLQPMELFMYGLWYAMAILVFLVLAIYYAAAKLLERWTRYNLWLITDYTELVLATGAEISECSMSHTQERLEDERASSSSDFTLV